MDILTLLRLAYGKPDDAPDGGGAKSDPPADGLTQERVNELIEARLKRERTKHAKEISGLREALGVEDETVPLIDAIAELR